MSHITNNIYIKYDANVFHKFYAPFHRQITNHVYQQENIILQKNAEFFGTKIIFWIYY